MTNLEKLSGLPLKINAGELEICEETSAERAWSKTLRTGELWKSLMLATEVPEGQEPYNRFNMDRMLYYGWQGFYRNDEELLKKIKSKNLRPDLTVIPAGLIGREFQRTEGHHHISLLPEVYETVHGDNIYLLFRTENEDSEDIDDVMAVFAGPGDHILFPPAYQHISINIGKEPFVMTDWVSRNANSDFKYIKRHNGAPYWVVSNNGNPEFLRNPNYNGDVPDYVRLVKPVPEIPEFGLIKGVPMFSLGWENNLDLLDFLNNNSDEYEDIYAGAFLPLNP